MGLYTEISIEDVIARTKMQLRIDNTGEHDDYLQVVIMEGLRSLECLSIYVKQQCTLVVNDRRAKIPDNFMRFIGMRHNVTQDGSTNSNCSYIFYFDRKFMDNCGCSNLNFPSTSSFGWSGMQIQGGYFVFNDDIPDGHEVTIAFLGYNVNEDGTIKILEYYERALIYYAMWNFADSFPNTIYSQQKVNDWKRMWAAQRLHVKGNDAADNFRNAKREITLAYQALVTSDYVNYLS